MRVLSGVIALLLQNTQGSMRQGLILWPWSPTHYGMPILPTLVVHMLCNNMFAQLVHGLGHGCNLFPNNATSAYMALRTLPLMESCNKSMKTLMHSEPALRVHIAWRPALHPLFFSAVMFSCGPPCVHCHHNPMAATTTIYSGPIALLPCENVFILGAHSCDVGIVIKCCPLLQTTQAHAYAHSLGHVSSNQKRCVPNRTSTAQAKPK